MGKTMETNYRKNENTNLDQLVRKLKVKDLNYASLSRAVQIIYFILIPLYAMMTIWEYTDEKNINELIGGGLFIISFFIFILLFRHYYKKYKYVDYSLPTIQMLKNAAERYRPFQKYTGWSFVALIIMDVGLIFDWKDESSVFISQVFFWGLIIIGLLIGLIIWYNKYKPIRDEALRLIQEIEGN
ncbi:MAG: hypothetical protein JW833_06515 [Prolixibacteraceae bacterium]|nr:hypothetical protein [Prolixibacteraceae bacterium]